MSLPSKNRRTITVGERRFHWVFDPFRLAERDAFIAVQDARGRGPKLLMRWVGLALPRSVREGIAFAVANGWNPDEGPDIEIGCDSWADPPRFRLKPAGSGPYWFHDDWFAANPDRVFATPMTDEAASRWK